jgi:hypothetical protein
MPVPRSAAAAALLALSGAASAMDRPHILHVIVDDFGWGNTNYHRDVPTPEISTPNMDGLVADGIKLMRHYVHAMCTPTRVSFQSGRLPMHSGQGSLCSPDQSACGIPYDCTTIAEQLKKGGYRAQFVGKWYTLRISFASGPHPRLRRSPRVLGPAVCRDCGMATARHTPHGRGYETALSYFGHGNYQWGQIEVGVVPSARLSPAASALTEQAAALCACICALQWGAGGGGNANRTVPPSGTDPAPGSSGMWPRDLWDTDRPVRRVLPPPTVPHGMQRSNLPPHVLSLVPLYLDDSVTRG